MGVPIRREALFTNLEEGQFPLPGYVAKTRSRKVS